MRPQTIRRNPDSFHTLAVDNLHHVRGITLPLHGTTRKRIIYVLEVPFVQVQVYCAGVLFEASHAACPRNRNNVAMPAEEPCERKLRTRVPFLASELLKTIGQREIG